MTITHIEDAAEFRETLEAGGVTLVDYGASWCPPCRALLPVLEEVNRERGEAVRILKVDVDEQPELASAAGVMSIPTVVVYRNGEAAEKLIGLQPKTVYDGVLNRYA